MEPILPEPASNKPNTGPQPKEASAESLPLPFSGAEAAPNVAPEQPKEAAPAGSRPAATSVNSPAPAAPAATQPVQSGSASGNGITDDPLIADDVDVIEKEWVDKAKKIVNATKEDPHQQEKEVSKLQADYLMKRYNKQLKLSE